MATREPGDDFQYVYQKGDPSPVDLDPELFRAWLGLHVSGQVVGWACVAGGHPFCGWLENQCGMPACMKEGLLHVGTHFDTAYKAPYPAWMLVFFELVDGPRNDRFEEVTVEEALTALDNALAQVANTHKEKK